jgi:hypothetical protein
MSVPHQPKQKKPEWFGLNLVSTTHRV